MTKDIMDVRKDYVELEQKLTEAKELIERYEADIRSIRTLNQLKGSTDDIRWICDKALANKNGGSDDR